MTPVEQSYLDWLCKIVRVEEQTLYWNDVIYALWATEFDIKLSRDANRVEDAYELRNDYRGFCGLVGVSWSVFRHPVSVLEVLIALARRGEWEIMHDPDLGDRTSEWFWTMIFNLGLEQFAYRGALDDPQNDLKFMSIMENFLTRSYPKSGQGGIFVDRTGKIDMRKEELWSQMCYFFDTFF